MLGAISHHITELIKDRIRSDRRFHERASYLRQEDVERHLKFNQLPKGSPVKLAKVLGDECVTYNKTSKNYIGICFDNMTVKELIENKYVSVDIGKKNTESRPSNSENNDFKRLLSISHSSPFAYAEMFVTFNIDKMSKDNLTSFPEIDVVKKVCNDLYIGLGLSADIKSMPVKTPRRKEGNGVVWCQIRYDINTSVLGKAGFEYARDQLCVEGLNDRTRLRVYFAVKDSVEGGNEWGSCPLLHVGTNFKTEDFSQVVYDNIHSSCTSKDNIKSMLNNQYPCMEKEICGVYSQKGTTLEIPSKLDEINTITRLSLEESDQLFYGKGEVSDELLVNLAFAHPKARIRQLITIFVTCVFVKEKASSLVTQVNKHDIINVGRDVELKPPSVESGYKISRKVCLSTDICFACDNEKCRGHGHLSHDIDLPCDKYTGQAVMNLKADYKTTNNSENYTMKECERAAMSHNFFCKGVRLANPITKTYSFVDKRKIFNVYGKVKDVVSTNRNMETAWRTKCRQQQQQFQQRFGGNKGDNLVRKRVFYHSKEDLKNAETIDRLSMAAFRDILYREVDMSDVERFFKHEPKLKSIDWYKVHMYLNYFMEDIDAIKVTETERLNKLYVDYASIIAPNSRVEKKLYNNEKNNETAFIVIRALLQMLKERNNAVLFTLMNKSMITESTMVLLGTRCAITDFGKCKKDMTVRQFVCASKDMEVALVDDDDLKKFTVVSGAVSATTAPNDTITDSACQTWRNNDMTGYTRDLAATVDDMYSSCNSVDDSSRRGRRISEDNRGVVGGLIGDYRSFSTNQRRPTASSTSYSTPRRGADKYVPPQLRN